MGWIFFLCLSILRALFSGKVTVVVFLLQLIIQMLAVVRTTLPSGHMTFILRRFNVDTTSSRCIDVEATLY